MMERTSIPSDGVAHRAARCALWLLFLANGLATGSWAHFVSGAHRDLAVSDVQAEAWALFIHAGPLIAIPLAGVAIALYGSRRPLIAVVAIAVLGLPLAALASNTPATILVLALHGAIVGAMTVVLNVRAVAEEHESGRAVLSSCYAITTVAALIAKGLLGFAHGTFGTLNLSLGAGIASCFVFVVAMAFADRTPVEVRSVLRRTFFPSHPHVWTSAALVVVMSGLVGFLPIWLVGMQSDLSMLRGGLAVTGFAASGIVALSFGDGLRDRFGAVATAKWGVFLALAGLVTVGTMSSPLIVIAGFVLIGAGTANLIPIAYATAGHVPGEGRGMAIATVALFGHFGGILPSLAGSLMLQWSGPGLLLGLLLLILLLLSGTTRHADGGSSPLRP